MHDLRQLIHGPSMAYKICGVKIMMIAVKLTFWPILKYHSLFRSDSEYALLSCK